MKHEYLSFSDAPSSFGHWVSRRRHALRLAQHEVANLVGCSVVLIRKIEADERRPSRQIAERLAQALHVPLDHAPAFVRVARAELAPDRLPPPDHGTASTAISVSQIRAPSTPAHGGGNLPSPVSSFHGRIREISDLRTLLQREAVRLITLTGPGGSGKTRLALESVRGLEQAYPDGIWFIDLAPVHDPAQIATVIAQTCGVPELPSELPQAQLISWLRTRRLLLVIDNYEHLIASAAMVSTLLHAAPQLQILVTSRVVLRLTGEHEYLVSPLPFGDAATPAASDAAQLFADRARAVQLAFQLTDTNTPIVSALCAQLDGLPLAIEIAAARMRLFTIEQLQARLRAAVLPTLEGGARDLPARQQTMRATIAWSYQLLSAPERRLLDRLSVFVGGWTLEAAEVVGQKDGLTVSGLQALIEHSLIQVTREADMPRFHMLETIREFAGEQLAVADHVAATQQAHAHYFITYAEQLAPQIYATKQFIASQLLLADDENLRAALEWLLTTDPHLALRFTCALWEYWNINGRLVEAAHWLTRVLAQSANGPPLLRAAALDHLGLCTHLFDENERAITRFRESAALFESQGEPLDAAFSTMDLCFAYRKQSRIDLGNQVLDHCLPIFRAHQSPYGIAWCHFFRGLFLMDQGQLSVAWEVLQDARAEFQQCNNHFYPDWIAYNLGHIARLQGDMEAAEQLYTTALTMLHSARDRAAIHEVRICLGHLARLRGEPQLAAAIYAEELIPLVEVGNRRRVADVLDGVGGILLQTRRVGDAARMMGAAIQLREAISITLALSEQPGYQRMLAELQDTLVEPQRRAAWEAGRALSYEQAIAEAHELALRCAGGTRLTERRVGQ